MDELPTLDAFGTLVFQVAGQQLSAASTRAIIYNSRLSARQHEELGYDPGKTVVIPNGFDCEAFRPRPEMAARLRNEARIEPGRVVVGMVARNHPQKDPGNLFKAAALLVKRAIDVHLVIVGPDFDTGNAEVMSTINQAGIAFENAFLQRKIQSLQG